MRQFFMTGTDTDVGKTYVTQLIADALIRNGVSTALFKPIAAGCSKPGVPMSNDDIAAFLATDQLSCLELMNVWCFDEPMAPHIAAAKLKQEISLTELTQKMHQRLQERSIRQSFSCALIEGAGGWKLPLNQAQTLDQWVVSQSYEVILVVGMKLGCLNHALLSVESIVNSGGKLSGWIANSAQPMLEYQENIATLKHFIPVPCIAEITPNQQKLCLDDEQLRFFGHSH